MPNQTSGNPSPSSRGLSTVFSDSAVLVGGRIANVVLGLGFVVIATRVLTPGEYGRLAYVLVVAALLATVASAWTNPTVPRYGREQIEARGDMVAVTWNRAMIIGPVMVAAISVVVLLKVLGVVPPEVTWWAMVVTLAMGVSLVLQDHTAGSLQAAGLMKRSAIPLVTQQLLAVVVLAVLVAVGVTVTPLGVAAVLTAATLVSVALPAPVLWKISYWPPAIDRALGRRMIAFSVPLIAFTVSQYVIRWVDVVIIRAFGSPEDVGLYTIAYQVYAALQTVVGACTAVLVPLLVTLRVQNEKLIERYLEILPQLSFVGATAVGLMAPAGAAAVPLVFGTAYASSAEPLALLLLALAGFIVANLLAPILLAAERTRAVGRINVVAVVVNVAGDLLLIGPADMGIAGAAVATSAATAVVAFGYYRSSRVALAFDSRRLNPALFAPLLLGVAAALLLDGAARLVIGAPAVLLTAAVVAYAVRLFRPADAELIAGLDAPARLKRGAVRLVIFLSR